jgi:very-short-patch-repair endonuclease
MSSQFIKKNSSSNAEWVLYNLLTEKGFKVHWQFPVQFEEGCLLRGTIVDFYFKECNLPVFLDGPHHLKPRYEERDRITDEQLVLMGFRAPLRISFNGDYKPSKKLLLEWVEQVKCRVEMIKQ